MKHNADMHDSYLIEAITPNKQGQDWLKEQIFVEGPPHKIVQHSLVLQRLEALLHIMETGHQQQFKPTGDTAIMLAKHDHSLVLPLAFPETSIKMLEKDAADKLTKGPDHEIAYTAMLLQAIEWMIKMNEPKE